MVRFSVSWASKMWLVLSGITLAAVLASAGPVGAVESLRPDLADMSQQIAGILKKRGLETIAVGAFTGPVRTPASTGPGIQRILIEELEKQSVRVQAQAKYQVRGDYLDVRDEADQILALRLKASVLDNSAEVIGVLDKKIEDLNVIAQTLGLNKPDLGAGLTAEKERDLFVAALKSPNLGTPGTPRVAASPKNRYGMEIHVRSGEKYQPLPWSAQDGLAFVQVDRGQELAVKLINASDHDAAVELTLDGLSMFAFSENKSYRHVIVRKGKSALIEGWHRTNKVSDRFRITEYAKSAVAELLANPDSIGTITATFAAAWDPKEDPPKDEISKFRDPFKPAFGRGEPVLTPYKEVVRERGRVRDVINVRYKKPAP